MKKRKVSIPILMGIIICSLLALKYIIRGVLSVFPLLSIPCEGASSIGIIGGADGPTAIFLSCPFKFLTFMPVLEFLGILYLLILLIVYYRKYKKENLE